MKKKEKLALIDNYVELHRVIFECKDSIKNANDTTSLILLQKLSISLIDLKNLYENSFKQLKMMDDSLILLKQQLEDALRSDFRPPQKQIFSHEFLSSKKQRLEQDLLKYI